LYWTWYLLLHFSGGKDSCYNMMQCVSEGHQIIALANLRPDKRGTGNLQLLNYYLKQVWDRCFRSPERPVLICLHFSSSVRWHTSYGSRIFLKWGWGGVGGWRFCSWKRCYINCLLFERFGIFFPITLYV
jgi:hypothetical protein